MPLTLPSAHEIFLPFNIWAMKLKFCLWIAFPEANSNDILTKIWIIWSTLLIQLVFISTLNVNNSCVCSLTMCLKFCKNNILVFGLLHETGLFLFKIHHQYAKSMSLLSQFIWKWPWHWQCFVELWYYLLAWCKLWNLPIMLDPVLEASSACDSSFQLTFPNKACTVCMLTSSHP